MNQFGTTADYDDSNILGYLNVLTIRRNPTGPGDHIVGGSMIAEVAPAKIITANTAHRLGVSGENCGGTTSTQKVKDEYMSGTYRFVVPTALFYAPKGTAAAVADMLADPAVSAAISAHTVGSVEIDLAIARYCLSQGYNTDPRDWGLLNAPANRCNISAWTTNAPACPKIAAKICSFQTSTESMSSDPPPSEEVFAMGGWLRTIAEWNMFFMIRFLPIIPGGIFFPHYLGLPNLLDCIPKSRIKTTARATDSFGIDEAEAAEISEGLPSEALSDVASADPAMCKQMSSMPANIYAEDDPGDPTDRHASTQKVKNEYLSGTDHLLLQTELFHG